MFVNFSMYKFFPILLFSYSLAVTTNDDQILDSTIIKYIESREKKYNLSLGIFDSRTGISVIGLSYDIYQQKDEIFISCGTIPELHHTVSAGWKHYLLDKNISPFTVVSLQAWRSRTWERGSRRRYVPGKAVTISLGLEYVISPQVTIQFGVNAATDFEDRRDIKYIAYPSIGFNRGFND